MKAKENLVIVITGGANGLGKYLTARFLEEGHTVNVIDIDKGENVSNARLNYYLGNVANHEDVSSIFNDIYKRSGRIDVLINNAAKRYFSFLENAKLDDIYDAIKVNITANYITTREALRYMKESGFGRIINISSNSSFKGYAKGSIYCATKASLNIFTEAISKEIDKNTDITINSICPSSIYSENREDKKITDAALIRPEVIFKIIYKVINGNLNGAIIPIVSFRVLMFNLLRQIKSIVKWINYFMWKYL